MMKMLVLLAAAGAACSQGRVESAKAGAGGSEAVVARVRADTVSGTVTEVGADPATWLSLRPLTGGQALRLEGRADALRSVTGAEVLLQGARQGAAFRVDSFTVRRVNGHPVDDGVLVVTADRVMLRMAPGVEREVPDAPTAMRARAGARVWVTHPVRGTSPSYGVIVQP